MNRRIGMVGSKHLAAVQQRPKPLVKFDDFSEMVDVVVACLEQVPFNPKCTEEGDKRTEAEAMGALGGVCDGGADMATHQLWWEQQ
jgi:hypothetical protein